VKDTGEAMTSREINEFWERLTAFRETLTSPQQQLLDAIVDAAVREPAAGDVEGYGLPAGQTAAADRPLPWGYARWLLRKRHRDR
jgi:hypothetical protein